MSHQSDEIVSGDKLASANPAASLSSYFESGKTGKNVVPSSVASTCSVEWSESSDSYDATSTSFARGSVPLTDELPQEMIAHVERNVELLGKLLAKVQASRPEQTSSSSTTMLKFMEQEKFVICPSRPILDVQEAIRFPAQDTLNKRENVPQEELDETVSEQLYDYMYTLATFCQGDLDEQEDEGCGDCTIGSSSPFHSYERASKAAVAVSQMLSLLVESSSCNDNETDVGIVKRLSNPLVTFASVFAAMIQYTDHPGAVVDEKDPLVAKYGDRCIPQQLAFDTAMNLLLEEDFEDLRFHIYKTPEEFDLFRHVVVNALMGTEDANDIVSIDFKTDILERRESRWNRAFGGSSTGKRIKGVNPNDFQATVVIELLLQAANVSYASASWDQFSASLESLLRELPRAPSASAWHERELRYLETFAVQPLKQLQNLDVFLDICSVQLEQLDSNRRRWAEWGEEFIG